MTKKLINIIVVIATGCNTLLYIILYTFGEELLFLWPSAMGTVVFTNGMRLITMLTIVIIGRITLNIRSKAEKAINRQIDMIHGQRAERLTVLRTLKRSVKDVVVLNFWTCAFLIPVTVAGLLSVLMNGVGSKKDVSKAIIFSVYALSFSNPFLYVLSQTSLKQWLFQRCRVSAR